MAEQRPSARVVITHPPTRQTCSALLELAGFQTQARLTAEASTEGPAVDVLIAADWLPGQGGAAALAAGKAADNHTHTVLLAFGPTGFAPDWRRRAGIDAVIPIRASARPWFATLADEVAALPAVVARQSSDATFAAVFHAVREGDAGFEVLADFVARPADQGTKSLQQACLHYLASAYSHERVLPLLERVVVTGSRPADPDLHRVAVDVAVGLAAVGFDVLARVAESSSAPDDQRVRAIDALAQRAPAPAVSAVVRGLLADSAVAYEAADALLTVARERGPSGLEDLVCLAEAPAVASRLRSDAVAEVARRFSASSVQSKLAEWATSDDPVLADAALAPGPAAISEYADTARSSNRGPAQRIQALAALGREASRDVLVPVLNELLSAKDFSLQAAAVEWCLRRPDVGPAMVGLIDEAGFERAALWGASLAGRAGFEPLSRLAQTAAPEVRADALQLLAVRFDSGRVLPIVHAALLAPADRGSGVGRAAVRAAVQLGRSGHAALRAAVTKGRDPVVRLAALEQLAVHGTPGVRGAAIRRALVDQQADLQAAAIAHAVLLADDGLSSMLDQIAKSRRTDLAESALASLTRSGPGGFAGLAAIAHHPDWPAALRQRAQATLRARHGSEAVPEAWEIAETAPAEAAEARSWSGPTAPAAPPGRRALDDREALVVDRPPRPPRSARASRRHRLLPLARATEALQTALDQGRGGFRALRTLADSARVPDEVRVQALRHLAADFPDRDVRPVLENALRSDRGELRTAALGALMMRDDAPLEPVAMLARDPATPPGLRMRAGRFLASRWSKREAAADLERMLDDDHSGVQRVALEGLFPSMHYTPPDRVETHLINILEAHESVDVRASAARALGVFGGPAAVHALAAAGGWVTGGELRAAVRASLDRLRARDAG